ncbi:methyltransferase family protein [Aspergillus undulatus]|uniref:methyltransferase family protein n=1 Tax=Aspergillus undulatus TaxID=1810928 RepID=UPI003CCD7C6C
MPSLSSSTLSLVLLVAGYLQARCMTSPNPARSSNLPLHNTDRIRFLTTTTMDLLTHASNAATIYQVLITLFSPSPPSELDRYITQTLLPYPENLNPGTVHWSLSTIANLILVAVGAAVRLSAYGNLGQNFTFHLAHPDRLITDGVYGYLQHPSYTGLVLVNIGYAGLVIGRLDTPAVCLVPGALLGVLRECEWLLLGLGVLVLFVVMGVRIRDEERMLRGRFGGEWERWHRRTARLVPGVF